MRRPAYYYGLVRVHTKAALVYHYLSSDQSAEEFLDAVNDRMNKNRASRGKRKNKQSINNTEYTMNNEERMGMYAEALREYREADAFVLDIITKAYNCENAKEAIEHLIVSSFWAGVSACLRYDV